MAKGIATNKSAAGLRRSAIAERLRLREEWSSLKGTDDENEPSAKVTKKQTKTFSKILPKAITKRPIQGILSGKTGNVTRSNKRQSTSDALRGVVALVDVGTESRALALRAALTALGASVVSAWSPLVTHLIWSQGGCRDTRAKARALACRVVSPLWVEACAASARRISEKVFPSTARDSDLPSPAALCRLLKTAEKENWLIPDFVVDSEDDGKQIRLRISSDAETTDKSDNGDTTRESVDVETRVNTAPRRALPISISPPPVNPKSRRKLFTVRPDAEEDSDAEETPVRVTKDKPRPENTEKRAGAAPNRPQKDPSRIQRAPERQKIVKKFNLTQEQKRNLKNAERMARKLAADPKANKRTDGTQRKRISNVPRIVLSGMPKSQFQAVVTAIQTLKGKIQKQVTRHTTHVLLGTCKEDQPNLNTGTKTIQTTNKTPQRKPLSKQDQVKPFSICNQCNSPEGLVMQMFECDNVEVTDHCSNPAGVRDKDVTVICSTVNRHPAGDVIDCDDVIIDVCDNVGDVCATTNVRRLRTLKTLLGAARGCRILHAQWALDSLKEKKWVTHIGYEVTHLVKIAQKARVERSAIDKMHSKYAYNVFRGVKVRVMETAEQRDAAIELLSLCGADVINEADAQRIIQNNNIQTANKTVQNGGPTQNGGRTQNGGFTQNSGRTQNGGFTQHGAEFDTSCGIVVIGKADEEVSSKWVFDSVAAGRPRTTRRYINKNIVL